MASRVRRRCREASLRTLDESEPRFDGHRAWKHLERIGFQRELSAGGFDSNMSALAFNLRRLASLMRADRSLQVRLDAALRRFLRGVLAILRAVDAYVGLLTV